jgi:hypothetical protein
VNELIRALKDARDLVEALLTTSGEPPQWLVDEANQELSALDELVARLEGARGGQASLVSPVP